MLLFASSKSSAAWTASIGTARIPTLWRAVTIVLSWVWRISLESVGNPDSSLEATVGVATRSGVTDPNAGEMTTLGPVHLDLLATTSASSLRSENSTFGWDFSCLHASSQGTIACATGWAFTGGFVAGSSEVSIASTASDAAIESLMASQKALPKSSDAHARQLRGSPEQVGGEDDCWITGKIEFLPTVCLFGVLRRRGTAG